MGKRAENTKERFKEWRKELTKTQAEPIIILTKGRTENSHGIYWAYDLQEQDIISTLEYFGEWIPDIIRSLRSRLPEPE